MLKSLFGRKKVRIADPDRLREAQVRVREAHNAMFAALGTNRYDEAIITLSQARMHAVLIAQGLV